MPLMVIGFGPLLMLLFVACAVGLLWWGFTRIPIPEPFKTVLLVVVGLIALFMLYQVVSPMLSG